MKRHATAIWMGPGKTGKGNLTTQSGTLSSTQYSWGSRFEEGTGTNPEELIAAAHAGCFTMKVSFLLVAAGFEPTQLETVCTITLDNGAITGSNLKLTGQVNGISKEVFDKVTEEARATCIISKVINAEITLEATLKA